MKGMGQRVQAVYRHLHLPQGDAPGGRSQQGQRRGNGRSRFSPVLKEDTSFQRPKKLFSEHMGVKCKRILNKIFPFASNEGTKR